MLSFDHQALPWHIVFGAGRRRELPALASQAGFTRVMVLCTPGQRALGEELAALLGERAAGVHAGARMHVPAECLRQALAQAQACGSDATLAVGGGSTIGLAKALALHGGLPYLAVPTTYAGSEMTNIWGLTEGGRKTTGRDPRVVPRLTLYDPELSVSLPADIVAASGLNALAQAVVNLTAASPDPIVALYAEAAVRALAAGLPAVIAQAGDIAARSQAMFGACLAGAALGTGSTGLHHRLCHVLGGSFGLPHAQTHAVLLPHTVAFNAAAAADGTRRVALAMGVDDAARGIHQLALRLGAPTRLRDLGLREPDLDRAAQLAVQQPLANPEPVDQRKVRALLDRAWRGAP